MITFPGSYHAGFSTGLNIGEAVNFATHSWCEFGMKCQAIYRASRERIPIFPIEWVMIENIKEINHLDLGLKELEAIQSTYQIYLLEEIKSRRKMENFIK
jgi:histone demethylase JARID1